MKKKDALGQFEQLVLTAVMVCREDAYGMRVHAKVVELAERPVKLPSVYSTLDRLEEKKYVKSWFARTTPAQGYKRARYFRLLPAGVRVLAESAAISQRLVDSWKLAARRKRAKM